MLDIKNSGTLSLDLAYIERLSVIVVTQLQLMNNYKNNPYDLSSNPMLQTI